jgi:outer membrane protein insertion porin family/translocation and assembly module TamA
LTFHRGEPFKASKIKESQRRLWDSQLFSFVDVTVQELDSDKTELPIVINLKEAKPYTVKAGAGYGTEDGLRGKVSFEARRFLGDARRLSLQAKASSLTQQLETQFLQPHFLFDPWWFDLRGGIGHNDEKSYETETLFVTPQINIPITSTLKGFVGPNVETNKITKLNIYPYNSDIPDRQKDNYFISSLIFGLANEKVDDILDPKKGFRAFATTEWASDLVGSDINYVKADLELRTYVPIFKKDWVLANRFHWGVISNPEQDSSIPIFKRFFAGGSNSNRGYAYHKLGPLDEWGNALGGRSIIEFNTDLRFPLQFITKDLEGVIFFDVGQVFPKEEIFMDELRYAVGAGLRYKTIIGPVRVDLGYAINPPENNPSGSIQFFLSIGQAF